MFAESDLDAACACLSIKDGVASYSEIASKDVQNGVNVKEELDPESIIIIVQDECPFPRSKSATADITVSAPTDEDGSGSECIKQDRKIECLPLALVRKYTPPSKLKSTRVFKSEAEVESEAIEEVELSPILGRSLSWPGSTSSHLCRDMVPIQRSQSCPGTGLQCVAANSTSGQANFQLCASQASGLGPTTSDEFEDTTAMSDTFKQIIHTQDSEQKRESLYELSKIQPPEERTDPRDLLMCTGEDDGACDSPTNERKSSLMVYGDDSTKGVEQIFPAGQDGGRILTDRSSCSSDSTLLTEKPALPPGTSNRVLIQPVSFSSVTADVVKEEVGEPPTLGQPPTLEPAFAGDVDVLISLHNEGNMVFPISRRQYYYAYEYTACLATSSSHRRTICRAPTQCTDVPGMKRSAYKRRSTSVCNFDGFKELYTYKQEKPFTMIYFTSEDMFGIDLSELKEFSRGGNSSIYSSAGECYALKKTPYKMEELNIIYKLHHINIVELLGVALIRPSQSLQFECYHIMYKMTCDLDDALSCFRPHGVLKHTANASPDRQCILYNTIHIYEQIMLGHSYLESMDIQHGDIKEKNTLLYKKCACSRIINCCCPASSVNKYSVKLADFDYIRYLDGPQAVDQRSVGQRSVGGTPTYRAPEQTTRRGHRVDHGGPYSDTWSVGVMAAYTLLGHGTSDDRQSARLEANLVVRQPHSTVLNARCEVAYVLNMCKKLMYEVVSSKSEDSLQCLVLFIAKCLEVDHKKRLSPGELLQQLKEMRSQIENHALLIS